ncbi:hypothetical protein [Bradyrhizobium ottawaense]|uniref:hypothetical protein n=1 Tax=Bradyrhizobium ottawaense TaxID=931866 RepID=UPI00351965FC
MIHGRTALELQGLAAFGASLEVDGSRYTALELQSIAVMLRPGSHLRVCNTGGKSALELQGIAAIKPGQVIFA